MELTTRIISPIESELRDFKTQFASALDASSDPLLGSVLAFVADHPGKMMRPILVLLFSKLISGVTSCTLHAAMSLELLHSASLIHDDVVDESMMRRGKPSVNARFGNKVAVLSGDFVLSKALYHARKAGDSRVMDLVIDLGLTLSEGEIKQIENLQNTDFSQSTYFEIISKKTASLFKACCMSGAYGAGANEEQVRMAELFGEYLGRAFQIVDDIFDYGEGEEIGKPVLNDMKEGKLTLPVLHALSQVDDPEHEKAVDLALKVRALSATDEDIQWLAAYSRKLGGIRYAYQVAEDLRKKAVGLLKDFEDGVGDALSAYFEYVTTRRK